LLRQAGGVPELPMHKLGN